MPNWSFPLPPFLPPAAPLAESGALPLTGLTVLLVEDSRYAAEAMRLFCNRSGARLRRAETLGQARAHLRTYCPDVVIVDLGLPDGRGDTLIRELSLVHPRPVILGLSGDPGEAAKALAAGADGFLQKPLGGVRAFQVAVMHHLPVRLARPVGADVTDGQIDPLALQDDLARAADLMAMAPDATARRYLAGFVAGVAHSAGDADLAQAARAAAATDSLQALQRLVGRRLGAHQPL